MPCRQIFDVVMWLSLAVLSVVACSNPYSQGQVLYETHCSRCHGMDGQGFEDLYPGIAESPYLSHLYDELACIIVQGSEYLDEVQGEAAQVPMPGNLQLSQVEVLNIINFLSWEFGAGRQMKIAEVQQALDACLD